MFWQILFSSHGILLAPWHSNLAEFATFPGIFRATFSDNNFGNSHVICQNFSALFQTAISAKYATFASIFGATFFDSNFGVIHIICSNFWATFLDSNFARIYDICRNFLSHSFYSNFGVIHVICSNFWATFFGQQFWQNPQHFPQYFEQPSWQQFRRNPFH